MLCISTSAVSTSLSSASRASACFRSSTTLRLPRFTPRKIAPMPGSVLGPVLRVESPSGGSILMTSAP